MGALVSVLNVVAAGVAALAVMSSVRVLASKSSTRREIQHNAVADVERQISALKKRRQQLARRRAA